MMEKTFLTKKASGTSLSLYVPMIDQSRLVGTYVTISHNSAQGASAQITAGKNGATHQVLTADLSSKASGTTIAAEYSDNLTESEKMQVFDTDTPIEIAGSNLNSSTEVTVVLVTDPFVIGSRVGLSS